MILYKIAYILIVPLIKLIYRAKIIGKENIPGGAAIVCANHTASLDPIFVAAGMSVKTHLHFMAKAELINIPVLGFLLKKIGVISVDRGKSDLKAIKKSFEVLKKGKKLMIFPEGTRVKEENASDAKTGASMIAMKTHVPVLPVYITSGKKKPFSKTMVKIGEPMIFEDNRAEGNTRYKQAADKIMEAIFSLGKET